MMTVLTVALVPGFDQVLSLLVLAHCAPLGDVGAAAVPAGADLHGLGVAAYISGDRRRVGRRCCGPLGLPRLALHPAQGLWVDGRVGADQHVVVAGHHVRDIVDAVVVMRPGQLYQELQQPRARIKSAFSSETIQMLEIPKRTRPRDVKICIWSRIAHLNTYVVLVCLVECKNFMSYHNSSCVKCVLHSKIYILDYLKVTRRVKKNRYF